MPMALSSHQQDLHFVMVPWMRPGHIIPMIDMARMLAARGVVVSVVTTPINASRIQSLIDRCTSSGLPIRFVTLRLPCKEAGLPEGCENLDMLPSRSLLRNFLAAIKMLRQPLEEHLREQRPPPSCVIAGSTTYPWTQELASVFGIPRLVFNGFGSFALLCMESLYRYKCHESAASDSEPFVLPGMPLRVELTTAQLPNVFNKSFAEFQDLFDELREGDLTADGRVVNSFEELEPGYAEELEKATGKKVWAIGPFSLCNKEVADKAERGNKASIDEGHCLNWLNSMKPGTVLYASFGSMPRFTSSQLVEVGLGLEASNNPFIWVIKAVGDESSDLDKWLSEGFEERTRDRGLLIRGWAPQVLILSHPSVGGFLTHCGWNSTLEGVSAGLPMVAWPLFAEQFLNAKLIVEVLGIAVGVGVKSSSATWMQIEEKGDGVLVARAEVAKAVETLMGGGEEGEERRKRARELGEMAKRSVKEGGSSYLNVTLLIQYVLQHVGKKYMPA